jgi:hypothetical protein
LEIEHKDRRNGERSSPGRAVLPGKVYTRILPRIFAAFGTAAINAARGMVV